MPLRSTPSWLLSSLLVIAPMHGWAQSSQPVSTQQGNQLASQLSEAAYERYTAGDFEASVELFERAIAYDPHPVLRFNYARTLEELDQLPGALGIYRQLVKDAGIQRVVRASGNRIEILEMRLLQEGYNPDTVTNEQYRPLATITVNSGIPNARVFVDGRRVGEGASVTFEWRAGARQLFVWADGWYPLQENVVFAQDGSEFNVSLRERTSLTDYVPPPPGLLTVVGPVSGMAVYVDGVLQEKLTPARELLLFEGTYDIVVRHPLYDDWHARVAVVAGEETRLSTENIFNGSNERRLAGRQRAGNAMMAVGGAGIAAGVTAGVLSLKAARDYRDNPNDPLRIEDRDRARSLARAADISYALGGAAFASGLIMRVLPARETGPNYEERLLDFSPGTVGSPVGATLTIRR